MIKLKNLGVTVGLVLMTACATILSADEVIIKKEEVPQAVLAALEKLAPGGTMERAEKQLGSDAKDGNLTYEMDVEKNGKHLRFILSPQGKLYERWDRKLTVADVPTAVKDAIHKQTDGAEPEFIAKIMPVKGKTHYRFRASKTSSNVSVTPDGQVVTQ